MAGKRRPATALLSRQHNTKSTLADQKAGSISAAHAAFLVFLSGRLQKIPLNPSIVVVRATGSTVIDGKRPLTIVRGEGALKVRQPALLADRRAHRDQRYREHETCQLNAWKK